MRALAGSAFRRADTVRDERGPEPGARLERSLRDLAGWWPPGRESLTAVTGLARCIAQQRDGLRDLIDADIVPHFLRALDTWSAVVGTAGRRKALDDAALVTALACIGEACTRRLGLQPHPVQYAGARALLAGCLAEMATGEGKTLVAAMAATVAAGSGARVHVISTNDYLARRDCEEMSPLFEFFGLDGGCVQAGMEAAERAAAYAHPICYVSGKEVVFDYLKDRLAGHGLLPAKVSQLRDMSAIAGSQSAPPLIPALHFAIVDEADSVLIDEARTPMILSRDAPGVHEPALLAWAVANASRLELGRHFRIGAGRTIDLLPRALEACDPLPEGVRAVWHARSWRELLVRQALTAVHMFLRDQHYIVVDGKVQIVDESTGRVMPDRSWEQGLHQLIEAKEGLALTAGRETLARMTFQRFFRRYFLLAGLTGTAAEASRELWAVYRLRVHRIPPDRPLRRRRLLDRCVPTQASKWHAVAEAAISAAARGQPVLVGTRSVEASEQVAAELTRRGATHVVLNARQDAEEAAIVAAAGVSGRITVATNMAGRGTDIKLDAAALAAGGLHVLMTEFHESRRVDRQLLGRCARQGEAGSAQAIVSAEDQLFGGLPRIFKRCMNLATPFALRCARLGTQRIAEGRSYRMRKQTLRQDLELSRIIGFAGRVM